MNLIVFGVVLPWVFVGMGCWLGFQLVRQNGRMLLRLEALEQRLAQLGPGTLPASEPGTPAGLPFGSPAPEFELPDLSGSPKSLAGFRGRRVLLIFFNPRCGFCTQMAPDLAALPVEGEGGRPLPLLVSTGDAAENRTVVEEHGIRCPVLLQDAMSVASTYQCNGTPMGYLIDEQGNIASPMAVGAQALLALVDPAAARKNGNLPGALGGTRSLQDSKLQRNGLPAGTPAPSFRLPLLRGGELSLEEYRGRRVLLVFSDPDCGPCDQLAPQLERLSRRTPGVQVLMVSRGDEEENRAKAAEQGLTFPIVLQRQWEISREYAMFATPIAYLIDEEGTIAADVAVGVDPILALVSGAPDTNNGRSAAPRQDKKDTVRRK